MAMPLASSEEFHCNAQGPHAPRKPSDGSHGEFIYLTQQDVARALGPLARPSPAYQAFYALCCADVLECVFLLAEMFINRGLPFACVPTLLLACARNARLTKYHYWDRIETFTALLDSPLAILNFREWQARAEPFLKHKLYRDENTTHRILRFGELFVLPACVYHGQWVIGSFQMPALVASFDRVRSFLGHLSEVEHLSDIGDRHVQIRKQLYEDLIPRKIDQVECVMIAHQVGDFAKLLNLVTM
jgi:hypothetical protein